MTRRPLRGWAVAGSIYLLVFFLTGCATDGVATAGGGETGAGGGVRPKLIEVRGYALAERDKAPESAIGYAVPIFTNREQALRFCPLFRSKLTFSGALDARTPLTVESYGRKVEIAPFIWPVTSWARTDAPTCARLVERYNISGAKTFFQLAQQAIIANGGRPADTLEEGPFIVTARRVSGAVMVYDLTRAPDGDYGLWLSRTITDLSNPGLTTTVVVRPPLRDQVRAFAFGAVPSWEGILEVLIPGFRDAHAKA